ncbi:MAG: hypothetical protein IRY91_04285 [Gemmatimonadaceae bacterium]|nr:hypothetical protein [Gemmatimonadaceae bacterium]
MARARPFVGLPQSRARAYIPPQISEAARHHERRRADCVARLLYANTIIRREDLLQPPPRVTSRVPIVSVGRAQLQLQRGSGGIVAAHCCPGQELVWGVPIQNFVPHSRPVLHYGVRGIVATTDLVPTVVNLADSLVEQSGLRLTLADSLEALFASLRADGDTPRTRTITREAYYDGYRPGAARVYRGAMQRLQARLDDPAFRRLPQGEQDRLHSEMAILQEFLQVAETYEPESLTDSIFNVMDAAAEADE